MPDLEEHLQELVRVTQTLLDHAEQAFQHYKSGEVQATCDAVSLSAKPLSQLGKEWKGILDAFSADGIYPSPRQLALLDEVQLSVVVSLSPRAVLVDERPEPLADFGVDAQPQAYEPLRETPTLDVLAERQSLLSAADTLEKRARAIQGWPVDEATLARIATIVTSVVAVTIARLLLDPFGL